MALLAISFHGIRLNLLRLYWAQRRLRQQLPQVENGIEIHSSAFQGIQWRRERSMGGLFVIFDWEHDEVIWQIAIDGAAGFCFHNELLYINLMRLDEVIGLDGIGRERQRFSHAHFNNIHTLLPSKRGFLLTSPGTDSILELDCQGNLLYEWCALDHGYTLLPRGSKRLLDRSLDHSDIQVSKGSERLLDRSLDHRHHFYPTDYHTTHVNSARFLDDQEKYILATLFHQGQVIEIEKHSGNFRTLLSGLNRPHDLRPYRNGWLLSNTGVNQTLMLDANWQIEQSIELDFNWVQSSAPMQDGSVVIADTNNNRLVRVYLNSQREIQNSEERFFPTDWRIYQVEEVPEEYVTFFQHPIAKSPF
jgi:hypothetical protein